MFKPRIQLAQITLWLLTSCIFCSGLYVLSLKTCKQRNPFVTRL